MIHQSSQEVTMHKCPTCSFNFLSEIHLGFGTPKTSDERNFGKIFVCPNIDCASQQNKFSWVEFDKTDFKDTSKPYYPHLAVISDFDLTLMLQEFSGWIINSKRTINFISIFKALETKSPEEKTRIIEEVEKQVQGMSIKRRK